MTGLAQSPWRLSWRADPAAKRLADQHYNRQNRDAAQFVPPGSCLVLKTRDLSAVWVTSWPKAAYVQHAWAGAWVNSLFRREGGPHLASSLITWAVAHTRHKWPDVPDLGIVTFVDPAEVGQEIPGWCYLRAGWTHVGYTAGGLWAYQQLPGRKIGRRSKPMPDPSPVPGSQPALFGLEAS